jgi:NTP pyrophosphatase (non-canonical NTP hydrolase)
MTIKEAQELVDAWIAKNVSHPRTDLTNMASLTEEVGELARVIALKYSDHSISEHTIRAEMSNEIGDVLWALISLANQAGIDLTESLIENLDKRSFQQS